MQKATKIWVAKQAEGDQASAAAPDSRLSWQKPRGSRPRTSTNINDIIIYTNYPRGIMYNSNDAKHLPAVGAPRCPRV